MSRAARVEDGYAYCGTCYRRVFKPACCSQCGGTTRAREGSDEPICPKCRRNNRTCCRCGKPVNKAGRIVRGKAVCASCAHYFTAPKPCANCGRLSRRLSRAPDSGFNEPVCDHCRNQAFETCCMCRRYRKVERRDEADRPLCGDCGSVEPVRHLCPDCGIDVPGGGGSRCDECALRDRACRRAGLNRELLEQHWVRSLFDDFCAWDRLRAARGDIAVMIDRYATFFATIDQNCISPGEITQQRLFDLFSAEGLRRGFRVVSFLCTQLGLEWDADALGDMIEARRIREQAQLWPGQPWAMELQRYVDHLDHRESRALKRKTVRMYQSVAAALADSAGVRSLGDLTQAHVQRYLRRHPGQVANLSSFVGYLREEFGIEIELKKKPKDPLRTRERKLLQRVQSLATRLDVETDGRRARAMLVALLAGLYQVPIQDLLAMSSEDVSSQSWGFVIRLGDREIRVDGRVSELFGRWAPIPPRGGPSLVFQGRNGVQPLSYDAVRYHRESSVLETER